ncbi:hypothetical protein [Rhizobium leguminosarum]
MREVSDGIIAKISAFAEQVKTNLQQSDLEARHRKTFSKIALGRQFDASAAIEVLLDDRPTVLGLKEALLAGLFGWIASPDSSNPVRLSIITSVIETMSEAERVSQKLLGTSDMAADTLARHVIMGSRFFEEIYFPIGGFAAFEQANSREVLGYLHEADSKVLRTSMKIMDYAHFAILKFGDQDCPPPSLNKGVAIVRKLNSLELEKARCDNPDNNKRSKERVSRTLIHNYWTRSKDVLALRYAARSIKVNSHTTLLDIIVSGKTDYKKHAPLLRTLLQRAKYVCDEILSSMTDTELYPLNVRPLRAVEPLSFPYAKLARQEIEAVTFAFTGNTK